MLSLMAKVEVIKRTDRRSEKVMVEPRWFPYLDSRGSRAKNLRLFTGSHHQDCVYLFPRSFPTTITFLPAGYTHVGHSSSTNLVVGTVGNIVGASCTVWISEGESLFGAREELCVLMLIVGLQWIIG